MSASMCSSGRERSVRPAPFPREAWDDYWAWLIEEQIVAVQDRREFDRDFTNTHRQTASPRPGVRLSRRWLLAEAEGLDARGALHEQVREAFDVALEALGNLPLDRESEEDNADASVG